jgi:hypothetical protein
VRCRSSSRHSGAENPAASSIVSIGRCRYTAIQSTSSVYCGIRPSVSRNQLMSIGVGSPVGHSTNGSLGVTMQTIARSAGGRSSAVSHWIRAP